MSYVLSSGYTVNTNESHIRDHQDPQ